MDDEKKYKPCPLCKRHGRGLQCPLCHGAGLVVDVPKREYNKKRNQKTLKYAERNGKHFSLWEKELLANQIYSSMVLARKLKRSLRSIENARYRMRKEMKKNETE